MQCIVNASNPNIPVLSFKPRSINRLWFLLVATLPATRQGVLEATVHFFGRNYRSAGNFRAYVESRSEIFERIAPAM